MPVLCIFTFQEHSLFWFTCTQSCSPSKWQPHTAGLHLVPLAINHPVQVNVGFVQTSLHSWLLTHMCLFLHTLFDSCTSSPVQALHIHIVPTSLGTICWAIHIQELSPNHSSLVTDVLAALCSFFCACHVAAVQWSMYCRAWLETSAI